jgi:hypothetical protein
MAFYTTWDLNAMLSGQNKNPTETTVKLLLVSLKEKAGAKYKSLFWINISRFSLVFLETFWKMLIFVYFS